MRAIDRKAVTRFFEWKPARWLGQAGKALVAAGALMILAPFGVDGSEGFRAFLLLSGAFIGVAGSYLAFRFLVARPRVPTKLYAALIEAKQRDLRSVLERSFKKIDTDIDDLLAFDAEDIADVNVGSGADAKVEALLRKSVLLYGPASSIDHGRLVIADGRMRYQFTPIQVWILYLTKDQLLTYDAVIDLTRGDLKNEAVGRLFLRNVVQISALTKTERWKETDHESMFRDYKATRGYKPKEIVERRHTIQITRTDGLSTGLPLGAPEIQDGDIPTLERPTDDDDNRYARVAQQIWSRINDTRQS